MPDSSHSRTSPWGRELPFWSDAFDRVSSERGGKRTSEWQDEWKRSVTICFANRTDSLQTCRRIVNLARWQSGHAEDCKSLYVGSIPARASKLKSEPSISQVSSSLGQLTAMSGYTANFVKAVVRRRNQP